jgi:hypothetical protein
MAEKSLQISSDPVTGLQRFEKNTYVRVVGWGVGVLGGLIALVGYLKDWFDPKIALGMLIMCAAMLLCVIVLRVIASQRQPSIDLIDIDWPKVDLPLLPPAHFNHKHATALAPPIPPEGLGYIKLQPNIVPLEPVEYEGHYEEFNVIVRGAPQSISDRRLIMVIPYHNQRPRPQRNTVQNNIGIAQGIKARLTFSFFTDRARFTVYSGAWVSETSNRVDFGVDDKRDLVLMIAHTNDATGLRYALEREVTGYYPNGQSVRHQLSVGDEIAVSITLLASDGTSLSTKEYMVELRPLAERPIAKVQELQSWRRSRLMEWQIEGYKILSEYYELEGDSKDAAVSKIRDWESRCGDGLEKYFSAKSKEQFIGARPTIDDGLGTAVRMEFRPKLTTNPLPTPLYWSLHDSVVARIEQLKKYETNFPYL